MKKPTVTPCRPYLLRAYYHWLLDNQLTPYLVAKADHSGVKVPVEAAKEGKVVLNIAPQAVTEFELKMDSLRFSACFNGIPREIVIPMAAVVGIYARENGAGTLFAEEPAYQQSEKSSTAAGEEAASRFDSLPSHRDSDSTKSPTTPPAHGRPGLRIIK